MPRSINLFGSSDAPLSVTLLLLNLGIGVLLSLVLRWHFSRFGSTLSNREEFAQFFGATVTKPLYSHVPPAAFGALKKDDLPAELQYTPDLEKAKKLLAQAGVGQDTVFELFLPQNYEIHVKAGEMYQDMLTKAGLNVKIKLVDWSTWISDVYRGAKYDLTVIGHTGKLDPDGTLGGYGTKGRYVKWINPRAAVLIDQARKVSGFENRNRLYDEVLELMAHEVPFMYLGS